MKQIHRWIAWLSCVGLALALWMCELPSSPSSQEKVTASETSADQTTPDQTTSSESSQTQVEWPKTWAGKHPTLTPEKRKQYPYVRGIVHIHSIYSHDACDSNPRLDGKKNLPCLQRLRTALCDNAIDVVFLTEHRSLMGEGDPIEDMMLYEAGDQKITEGTAMIGNQITCKDGHSIILFPGAENALMPVALKRHPTPLAGQTLEQTYNATSPEAIQKFKEAGAAVIVNHAEGRALEYMQQHDIHGLEIYNLHAVIDPRIRKSDLNLPQQQALEAFFPYLHPEDQHIYPHPDFVFLGFHEPLQVILDKWNKLLAQKMVYGYGGTDAHENVLKANLKDGDRADSYGRMMRWFSNHFLVKDKTWQAYREALFAGRSLVVFEILGTPERFEFYGTTVDGKRVEMGESTPSVVKAIHVMAQHPYQYGPEPVDSEIRLIHITPTGIQEVKREKNTVLWEQPKPGTYRVEVWITPKHLTHLLTSSTAAYMKSFPWIYSNPIRIQSTP